MTAEPIGPVSWVPNPVRQRERDYSLEEVRNELPDAVAQAQYRERLEAYVKTLRAKAQIDYRMP